jgi:thimet oligopeptidase
MPKPLCPCCFQAYSASVISGETTTTTTTKQQLLTTTDDATTSSSSSSTIRQSFYCVACAPSDVERALATKAAAISASKNKKKGDDDNMSDNDDDDVPPIVWYLTPEEIKAGAQQIVKDTKNNLDSIAAVPLESVTFNNTILKLMTPPNYKTNPQVAACKFLQHCSTDPTIRAAASQAGKDFASSRVQGRMRVDVYERVKAFSMKVQQVDDDNEQQQQQQQEEEELNEYQKHFAKAVLEDFQRAGLALSSENQKQLQLLLEQDSKVCSEYSQNLSTDETKLFFSPEELKGCTDDYIQERLLVVSSKDENEEDVEIGKYCTITLKYPDIIPIGQTCEVSETRRKVIEAREGPSIAYKNNLELVVRGITLRKKIATLLGYPSWAEYICTKRMSGSYDEVDKFLNDIEDKLKLAGKDDYNALLELKKAHWKELGTNNVDDNDDTVKLNAWDTSFYTNLLLKTKYGVDSESIKEYFPLDHVVETTLSIYQELLGLTFKELSKGTYWSWHTDVRCFKVNDTSTKEHIGYFYLDLHPRSGTYCINKRGRLDCIALNRIELNRVSSFHIVIY